MMLKIFFQFVIALTVLFFAFGTKTPATENEVERVSAELPADPWQVSYAQPVPVLQASEGLAGESSDQQVGQSDARGPEQNLSAVATERGMGSTRDIPLIAELAATPIPPQIPVRIVIPAIGLDAPVVPIQTTVVKIEGKEYQQWEVPNEFAAGWHISSARLGELGNTVLNGHHNVEGEVFGKLVDLKPGDLIIVYSETRAYQYVVANKMILPEKYQQLDVRMDNARWILPSIDERLTLVTCWPHTSNTHRLIIVASPLPDNPVSQ